MTTVSVNGGELAVRDEGSGEPVLLIHGAFVADSFGGLTGGDGLDGNFRFISYHRRGYGGSEPVAEGFKVEEQAADAAAVLDQLDVSEAHVIAHSYGAAVALQLALDAPGRVRSLSLLEPPIMLVPAAAEFVQGVEAIGAMWGAGEKAGAVDALLQAVGGPDYRSALDAHAPGGWFDAATSAVDAWFMAEAPSLGSWQFGPDEAARVTQPCLLVTGDETADLFGQSFEWQQQHLPDFESLHVAGATHLLQLHQPRAIAPAIGSFLGKHPMR